MKSGIPPLAQLAAKLKLRGFSFLLLVFIFLNSTSYSQNTPISGVVNSYYSVTEIIPAKACVRVTNPAGLSYNDKVMLIQMKGANININDNSGSFGDTTSLNNAGNYEIGRVCTVIGDSVFLIYTILNQYTVSGKVQLVKIPEYVSATVVDTLKAAPWNNSSATGGVLAISVEEDLILNAPVYNDWGGFRGGTFRLSSGDCGDFFLAATAFAYNANDLAPQNGAFKGEAIVELDPSVSGGRGAPANGGGGGNNHNNGGGGGANLTAGGIGGGNSSSAGCETTLEGRAGKALSSHAGSKIFFGGGGGAGHSNNGTANTRGGGNGGGIVFIQSNNLISNSNKIISNGQVGGAAIGDGAGGGGAGGTIILNIANYAGPVTIQANGGAGGNLNNQGTASRCYGAGGGGSGGAIYFTGAMPAGSISVNGGIAGVESNRSTLCNAPVPPGNGSVGAIISNYNYAYSSVLASTYCALLLPVEIVYFKARYVNGQVELSWEVAQPGIANNFTIERSVDGSGWIPVHQQPGIETISAYKAIDYSPISGISYYRLKIIDHSGAIAYSVIKRVNTGLPAKAINIYPNPAKNKLYITGDISTIKNIRLLDLSGKLLWQKNNTPSSYSIEIDLPVLPAGIYMIKIGEVLKKLSIY